MSDDHQEAVYSFRRFAARNVAKKLGVKAFDFMPLSELFDEIKKLDSVAHEKLIDYLNVCEGVSQEELVSKRDALLSYIDGIR
ncbi:MAG: hypothetical protein ACP5SH_21295 [Syntrophobacteraceae bacterium]